MDISVMFCKTYCWLANRFFNISAKIGLFGMNAAAFIRRNTVLQIAVYLNQCITSFLITFLMMFFLHSPLNDVSFFHFRVCIPHYSGPIPFLSSPIFYFNLYFIYFNKLCFLNQSSRFNFFKRKKCKKITEHFASSVTKKRVGKIFITV